MSSIEQGLPSDESRRRLNEVSHRILAGGTLRAYQEQVHDVGVELRNRRWQQERSLEEVASQLGVSPEVLGFFEIGWMSPDEFLSVIDTWAKILGQDGDFYRRQVFPSP